MVFTFLYLGESEFEFLQIFYSFLYYKKLTLSNF